MSEQRATPDIVISPHPVTNAEWADFAAETGADHISADGKSDFPVTKISWHEAQEYCAWLSKQTGSRYTLPTDAEWQSEAEKNDWRIDKLSVWEWTDTDEDYGKVVRGGAWLYPHDVARCAFRSGIHPVNRNSDFGFRVVLRSPPVVVSSDTLISDDIEQAYIALSFAGVRPNSLAEGIEALRKELADARAQIDGLRNAAHLITDHELAELVKEWERRAEQAEQRAEDAEEELHQYKQANGIFGAGA